MWHNIQDHLARGTLHKDYPQDTETICYVAQHTKTILQDGTTQKPIKHVAQNTNTICCVAQHTKSIPGSVFSSIFNGTFSHNN